MSTFDEGNAKGILDHLIVLLAKSGHDPETAEDVDGDDDSAEVRIGYGGRDLYDLTIKRV